MVIQQLRSILIRFLPRSFASRVLTLVWLGGMIPLLLILIVIYTRGRGDAIRGAQEKLTTRADGLATHIQIELARQTERVSTLQEAIAEEDDAVRRQILYQRFVFSNEDCLGLVIEDRTTREVQVAIGVPLVEKPEAEGVWWTSKRHIVHRNDLDADPSHTLYAIWTSENVLKAFLYTHADSMVQLVAANAVGEVVFAMTQEGSNYTIPSGFDGSFEADGERVLYAATELRLRESGEADKGLLRVVALMYRNDANRHVTDSLQLYGLLTLLSMLLFGLIGMWTSRFVSQPILGLVKVASDVEQGNLDTVAEMSGVSEVETLARSMNRMVEEVKRYRGRLHEEVESRTQSLADSRVRLEFLAARLRSIYDAMEEGLMVTDTNGNITDVNRRFREIFSEQEGRKWYGTHLDAFWGDCLVRFGGKADLEKRIFPMAALESGARREGWHADKISANFRVFSAPVTDETGALLCRLWLFEDQTERRELEDNLLRSQKMDAVGRLAGGMAHDFNNLLTVISGFAEALVETLPETEACHEDALEIQNAANSAMRLTEQLLSIGHRQKNTKVETVVGREVIERMHGLLAKSLGAGVKIFYDFACEQTQISISESQLQQVVLNLCLNARDAMDGKGELHVRTRRVQLDPAFCSRAPNLAPGPYMQVMVEDNGIGMNDETLEHIFEPFFTTKSHGKGTGLGLASVYGIMQQAGGYVDVRSQVGVGTAFHLFFSAEEITAPQMDLGIKTDAPGGNESIVVVEDEAPVRLLMEKQLKGLGYRIRSFSNGVDALASLKEEPTDLLVTDLLMPIMSGTELAQAAWEIDPGQGVLFVSGFSDGQIPMSPGGVQPGFLRKPFNKVELAIAIRRAFSRKPEMLRPPQE